MPADLVFGVVGVSPEAPCHVMFVESLRDNFKFAYGLVRDELRKNARWQRIGYDTNLKPRHWKVGDEVIRMHEPLRKLKLVSNWDGPFVITRVVSESTCVIRSLIGKLYKSNVGRLRPWRGRALTTERYGDGLMERIGESYEEEEKAVEPDLGLTEPKTVKVVSKMVRTKLKPTSAKVSTNVGVKGRKRRVPKPKVAKPKSIKTSPATGLLPAGVEGVRRSARLIDRGAVT